ncbi:Sialic acid transporter NanT [Emticicia aquatica]|uniref:Sialic acid transporter NanT n=1 Tax=Emticicia aquatica TaxID=1681835 RepID=A0ABN8EX48_9BACT|nr:MFS transporter [Emticicia aquatica]CAH0995527.1 Sialic acid transporter NanT [Emticicia aquatica]
MSDSKKNSMFSIIGASSVGTMIEWYDFYIFGSLATVIASKFFPAGPGNETLSFLSTLATFAAGFVVRPFGALFFGRLGDLIGRKYTFMVTLLLMGGATFAIGCIPSYETIGMAAPMLVLLLRLLQGLALGGEYGGAATYVAEHSPTEQRGYMTSWIQITATAGLIVSLIVIAITKLVLSKEDFDVFGWRIPFLASIFMVGISYIIRRNMHESPLFSKAKAEGKTSTNPLKESFGNRLNFKYVLLALLGVTMGQGVVWYTGQFYAMSFIEKIMNVPKEQVDSIMIWGLCLGTPFFVVFGWLSDRIGRKWIMLGGMLVAILSYRTIYSKMYDTVDIKGKTEIVEKATSVAELKENAKNKNGGVDSVFTVTKAFTDGTTYKEVKTKTLKNGVVEINEKDGKPLVDTKKTVTITDTDKWTLIWFVFIQMLFVTMVYGPVAAFLVEMFPIKIRYTSMSLPYHIGNGIFGGLLPAIATFLVTNATKANTVATEAGLAKVIDKPYLEGLWYPIIIAGVCFVIGTIYLNNNDNKVND